MKDFTDFVVVPCSLWALLFIVVWGIDKLWEQYKLYRVRKTSKRRMAAYIEQAKANVGQPFRYTATHGTPTSGASSKEDLPHE